MYSMYITGCCPPFTSHLFLSIHYLVCLLPSLIAEKLDLLHLLTHVQKPQMVFSCGENLLLSYEYVVTVLCLIQQML